MQRAAVRRESFLVLIGARRYSDPTERLRDSERHTGEQSVNMVPSRVKRPVRMAGLATLIATFAAVLSPRWCGQGAPERRRKPRAPCS